MTKTRREFAPEFKREAIGRGASGKQRPPLIQIATELRDLPIHAPQLAGSCQWGGAPVQGSSLCRLDEHWGATIAGRSSR
jgi:hypothetical protein